MITYVVIESTPGYLADDTDPFTTEDYAEAVAHAHELADELEEHQGYSTDRGCASSANLLAIYATHPGTVAPDLGRWIAIEIEEDA